jgi:hypothetical protein
VEAEDMGVEAGSGARALPDTLDLAAVEVELIVSANVSVGTEIVDFDFWKSVPSLNGTEAGLVFCTGNSCFW